MEDNFTNIHIVMVGTTHPGNIGGVARAMKNMGLSRLSLVAPEAKFPHPKATARASGAVNVLENTQIFSTLEEAIADCSLVIGTSARMRTLPWPVVEPRECAARVMSVEKGAEVAIVLGRENSGLTNEELALCQLLVTIPTNPDFSSLNIAAAAQVICYEIRLAAGLDNAPLNEPDSPLATSAEIEGMFAHFEQALTDIEFLKTEHPGQLMRRLRRLFTRTGIERLEVNILRGMLKAAQKAKSGNEKD